MVKVATRRRATMEKRFLFVSVWLTAYIAATEGHGRLVEPPSRGTAWRAGFLTPPNYNDHETNCGGRDALHQVFNGKCGVCGDPLGGPRRHEPGPDNQFATGTIVRTYGQGESLVATVEITASHKGFYEFRLCKNDIPQTGMSPMIAVQQNCFDVHRLQSPDGKTRFDEGVANITLKLPSNVVCSACVLQWRWKTGNSWGCEGSSCGIGLGEQEEFWACADIAVVPRGEPRTQLAAISSSSPSSAGATTVPATRFGTITPRPAASRSRPTTSMAQGARSTTGVSGSGSRNTAVVHRHAQGVLRCRGLAPWGRRHDAWCNTNCNHSPPHCPPSHCTCRPSEPAV